MQDNFYSICKPNSFLNRIWEFFLYRNHKAYNNDQSMINICLLLTEWTTSHLLYKNSNEPLSIGIQTYKLELKILLGLIDAFDKDKENDVWELNYSWVLEMLSSRFFEDQTSHARIDIWKIDKGYVHHMITYKLERMQIKSLAIVDEYLTMQIFKNILLKIYLKMHFVGL